MKSYSNFWKHNGLDQNFNDIPISFITGDLIYQYTNMHVDYTVW